MKTPPPPLAQKVRGKLEGGSEDKALLLPSHFFLLFGASALKTWVAVHPFLSRTLQNETMSRKVNPPICAKEVASNAVVPTRRSQKLEIITLWSGFWNAEEGGGCHYQSLDEVTTSSFFFSFPARRKQTKHPITVTARQHPPLHTDSPTDLQQKQRKGAGPRHSQGDTAFCQITRRRGNK